MYLIMKNIFKIHIFFYLVSLILILTGYIKDLIYIMFIILFHELGHILIGIYYKWKIEKVIILPFGAITIFNTKINIKLKEEFLVTIMGPLFQSILFLINNNKFIYYNKLLLIFNLIPIIPLDGSKLLNIILNKMFSFYKSNLLSIIISIILIIILFTLNNNLIGTFIIIFLSIKVIESIKNNKYIFNKFLFERYLYNFNFKKIKIVNNIKKMKKEKNHIFNIKNKYITEREYLRKLFDK